MKTKKYTVGFDIGITSNGWAILNEQTNKIEEMGVRMFNDATQAKENRLLRSQRRNLTRKKWRKQQLKNAFVDFGFLTEDEIKQDGYLSYTTNNENISRPKYDTVYHLRKAGLDGEKLTNRELLLALYSICRTRGNFLHEDIDFSKDTIDIDLLCKQFYELVSDYVNYKNEILKESFENDVLKKLFNKDIKSDDIKKLQFDYYCDDNSYAALTEIIKLLNGQKAKINSIDENLYDSDKTVSVDDLKKSGEDLNNFLEGIIDLYDCIQTREILIDYKYICEKQVDVLDKVKGMYSLAISNKEKYEDYKKKVQSRMVIKDNKKAKESLKVVRNIDNNFPNGWYVKEVHDLLKVQQKYNDKITDNFIEVCSSIISARIPYYIGPLSEEGKNSWIVKKDKFKYSYAYSKDKAVDELESIKKWKKAMISHCTYFPEEEAMPKGSFLYETFAILNEMNVLKAEDENNNSYYLTMKDKIKIIDELFLYLKKDVVKFSNVKDILNLKSFGTSRNAHSEFKNKYTLYKKIVEILPQYEIKSITEIFEKDNEKIKMLEQIILDINLFDEESSKRENFKKEPYNFSEEECIKLSKLKSNGFYSLSKKMIYEQPLNEKNETMIAILFDDNSDYSNEQQSIISKAIDENGEKRNLLSNKYQEMMKKGQPLSIDLLIHNGKNTIPISRTVIRALNECFKVYEEIIKVYGVPDRVVIETAKLLKDSSKKGEESQKSLKKLERNYDYLQEQIKHNENLKYVKKGTVDNWNKIKQYIEKNKKKIELYISQNGVDMLSGDKISIDNLSDYEIDHILPRGFGDDSMDNLMLIRKSRNSKKSNRVPLEFIGSGEAMNDNEKVIVTSDFIGRCKELLQLKLISEKKYKQLTLEKSEVEGFINRNLVDTRYIISEFIAILNAYNKVNGYNTHIVALKSAFTKVYRDALRIQKDRNCGDQHHAYDAATVVIADKVLSTYYPNYDSIGNYNYKRYKFFIDKISKTINEDLSDKYKTELFIQRMYRETFNENYNDENSLVADMKKTKPLYSLKVEKNYTNAFFKATIQKQIDDDGKERNKKTVLDILNVNDNEKAFTEINCVAVDFYKYKTKKGEKKHVAIQIPYVIVDSNGEINKEKYIKLIKEWYKVPDLLDKDNLRTEFFRFRAFNKDLIYDTVNNNILEFITGSIANKVIEFRCIDIFNYDDIYTNGSFLKSKINKKFEIYSKDGKVINDFNKLSKEEIVNYCLSLKEKYVEFPNDEYKHSVIKELKKVTNLYEFSKQLAYISAFSMWSDTSPNLEYKDKEKFIKRKRYIKTVNGKISNSDLLKKLLEDKQINEDTFDKYVNDSEYVKVKCSVLGIRWENAKVDDEKIQKIKISGPKKAPQLFKKIKKEEFYWNISRKMI